MGTRRRILSFALAPATKTVIHGNGNNRLGFGRRAFELILSQRCPRTVLTASAHRFLIYLHGSVVGIASSTDSAVMVRDNPKFARSEVVESLTTGMDDAGGRVGAFRLTEDRQACS